jgi:hypothetical protein
MANRTKNKKTASARKSTISANRVSRVKKTIANPVKKPRKSRRKDQDSTKDIFGPLAPPRKLGLAQTGNITAVENGALLPNSLRSDRTIVFTAWSRTVDTL